MQTPQKDLVLNQGADFYHMFIWVNENSDFVNFTGAIANMQIREHKSASTAIISLSSDGIGPLITLTPGNGTIEISIPAETTEDFAFESGVYDIEMVFDTGQVVRVVEGNIALNKEVTRV